MMEPLEYLHLQLRLEGIEVFDGCFLRQIETVPGEDLPLMLIAQLFRGECIAYFGEFISPGLQQELAASIPDIPLPAMAPLQEILTKHGIQFEVGRYKTYMFSSIPNQAKQKEPCIAGLVLHSDRGYQYTSHSYAALIQDYAITPSMSRPGNCWDNAPMENFFSHLKEEALRQHPIPNFAEAQHIIDDYIHFYNYERIQLKTRQTPYETRCLSS